MTSWYKDIHSLIQLLNLEKFIAITSPWDMTILKLSDQDIDVNYSWVSRIKRCKVIKTLSEFGQKFKMASLKVIISLQREHISHRSLLELTLNILITKQLSWETVMMLGQLLLLVVVYWKKNPLFGTEKVFIHIHRDLCAISTFWFLSESS